MAENSGISWTTHTFNPWLGCTAVSPACDHCYAERLVNGRMGGDFSQRRRTSAGNWRQPVRWNARAAAAGVRDRVFVASLADVFDNKADPAWRDDLWALVRACPALDWLLLTKRPQNIRRMLPADWADGYRNVWLGTTVENQTEAARRLPHLLTIPAALHFLSCEPLLGPVDVRTYHGRVPVGWVIAGGESGPGARPMHPGWVRHLRDQCAASGVPFHFKQWGEWGPHPVEPGGDLGGEVRRGVSRVVHPGGETDEQVVAATGGRNTLPGSTYMRRDGVRNTGHRLDGLEHQDVPASLAAVSP